jgi:hypothetical protein
VSAGVIFDSQMTDSGAKDVLSWPEGLNRSGEEQGRQEAQVLAE